MPRASALDRILGSKLDSWRVMANTKAASGALGTLGMSRTGYIRSGRIKPFPAAARPAIIARNGWSYWRAISISRAYSSAVGRLSPMALNSSSSPIWASRRAARTGSRLSKRARSGPVGWGSGGRVMLVTPAFSAASWP